MPVAQRYQDDLERIKKNVKKSYEYNKPNCERFWEFKQFVFASSLSGDDIAVLQELGKPELEFNVLEAYISRLRGEYSKQEPSITVSAAQGKPVNPQTIAVVEGHLRAILQEANNDSFEYEIYTDLLTGGFSVMKVWTEYANEMSFNQVIKWGRSFDPTMCGFDITARKPHKGDGQYCFENYPKTVDEFKSEFGNFNLDNIKFSQNIEGFNWSYRTQSKDDILLLSDYYEKKERKAKIVQLANNQVMTTDDYDEFVESWRASGKIQQPPKPVGKSRNSTVPTVCRYQTIENQIIDYEETDYRYLPYVFIDGNSIMLRNGTDGAAQQMTRPYVYHAKGQQKLINFAGQSLANELENMVQHKWKVAKESITPEYSDALTNNQVPNVVIYNAFADTEQQIPVPPPQEVMRTPAPPEIMNTFATGSQMIQSILGSYDASLGINDNQLSGVAIVEGATQSNAAAMPYVVGVLQGFSQAAQITVDLLPKYAVTPMTLPIVLPDGKKSFVPINQQNGISIDYDSNALSVTVEAGVNFAIQKSRALQQIIALTQASPLFAQFINQEGLGVLLDNLEIRGVDQLKEASKDFMQQLKQHQQQQSQQPNPAVMKVQQEQQKMQMTAQQNQVENQLRSGEIANDAQANDNDRLKIMLQARQAGQEAMVQINKAQTEQYAKAVDLALQTGDQHHRHTKEAIELTHNILTSQQQLQQQQESNAQT